MGMQARIGQDEEVGYIHDANAKFGSVSSQERRCCNHFKVYFYTNTDKYAVQCSQVIWIQENGGHSHVRIDTVTNAGEFPY